MDYRSEGHNSYLKVKNHLDEIVDQIRSKDVPLEKALDLYEEAIKLGNSCADMIDKADFSMEELEAFNASKDGSESEDSGNNASGGNASESNAETAGAENSDSSSANQGQDGDSDASESGEAASSVVAASEEDESSALENSGVNPGA